MQKKVIQFAKKHGLLIIVLGFFLWQKIPVWINEYQTTGQSLQNFSISDLDKKTFSTDELPYPSVFIFWATWCGPCKIEMERLQSAVNKGEVDPKKIIAISFNEDETLIRKSIQENKYSFQFFQDSTGKLGNYLKIRGTPTVIHFDKHQNIQWMNTGISLLGVQKAISLIPPLDRSAGPQSSP